MRAKLVVVIACAAVLLAGAVLSAAATPLFAADPLPSWNETASRQAIIAFVEEVTTEGSPEFVPPAERTVPRRS